MPTALITGASTGIGRDLAEICADAGNDLIVVARNAAQLQELASSITARTSRQVRVMPADLSQPGSAADVFAEAGSEVDILINNAGVGLRGYFSDLDVNATIAMLRLNVEALTHLTRLFLPGMLKRSNGRILNVASTAAFQPGPLMAVYYASKAYVLSLSEALHHELAGSGVTVTALCPGPTATEFVKRANMGATKLFTSGRVMDSRAVAQAGYDAMMRGKAVVIPGLQNRLIAFSTRFAPRQLTAGIARRLQEL